MSLWHDAPDEDDFAAAQAYLELLMTPKEAKKIVKRLRHADTVTKKAKDVVRASRLALLPKDNIHVKHHLDKIEAGGKLNLILLLRGEPLIIADGYHRACAVYWLDEDTDVRCRIADRPDGHNDHAADLARESFVSGWAKSGGPLTDRVAAGCAAAVEMARHDPDDPAIGEVTLQLGALEGMWARIYSRRDGLYTAHTETVSAAWQAFAAGLDVAALVADLRTQWGLTETTAADRRRRRDEAIAAALAALQALAETTGETQYRSLVVTIDTALRDGYAEGAAGAVAIAANATGHTGAVDFDQAYNDARAAITNLEQYTTQAHEWAAQLVAGAATDLGAAIEHGTEQGLTADEITADSENTVASDNNRAVTTSTDSAVGQGFTLGALAIYSALLVSMCDWVTAGDTKVCARCMALEAGGPYPILTTPQPPQHPFDRCVLVPASPVDSLGKFADYLIN